jgi:hypothetical protein
MSAAKRFRLGDLQLKIMKVLWERGEASVADVAAALDGARWRTPPWRPCCADGGPWLVRHTGEPAFYRPAVTPDAVTQHGR